MTTATARVRVSAYVHGKSLTVFFLAKTSVYQTSTFDVCFNHQDTLGNTTYNSIANREIVRNWFRGQRRFMEQSSLFANPSS
jgi:hypothetical protein